MAASAIAGSRSGQRLPETGAHGNPSRAKLHPLGQENGDVMAKTDNGGRMKAKKDLTAVGRKQS